MGYVRGEVRYVHRIPLPPPCCSSGPSQAPGQSARAQALPPMDLYWCPAEMAFLVDPPWKTLRPSAWPPG